MVVVRDGKRRRDDSVYFGLRKHESGSRRTEERTREKRLRKSRRGGSCERRYGGSGGRRVQVREVGNGYDNVQRRYIPVYENVYRGAGRKELPKQNDSVYGERIVGTDRRQNDENDDGKVQKHNLRRNDG